MESKNIDIRIRDADEGEREALLAVTLAAYEQYATSMSQLFWTAYRQIILNTLVEEGPEERIVAEHAGQIIGSVLLYPPTASAYKIDVATGTTGPEVRLLAVDPAMRDHGIGKMLMLECIKRARNGGYSILSLHTMDIMQTAMQMYERMGFVRVPELDFRPAENIVVKGYHLTLEPKTQIVR